MRVTALDELAWGITQCGVEAAKERTAWTADDVCDQFLKTRKKLMEEKD